MCYSQCDTELAKQDVKPTIYSYNELRVATRDFNLENKLGEGGFGVVYKVRGLVSGLTMVHCLKCCQYEMVCFLHL
jgi:hypothetical protein